MSAELEANEPHEATAEESLTEENDMDIPSGDRIWITATDGGPDTRNRVEVEQLYRALLADHERENKTKCCCCVVL